MTSVHSLSLFFSFYIADLLSVHLFLSTLFLFSLCLCVPITGYLFFSSATLIQIFKSENIKNRLQACQFWIHREFSAEFNDFIFVENFVFNSCV